MLRHSKADVAAGYLSGQKNRRHVLHEWKAAICISLTCLTVNLVVPGSASLAQQFRSPNWNNNAPAPRQVTGGYAPNHPRQATFPDQTVVQQQRPAPRTADSQSPGNYAPPVHIAPGTPIVRRPTHLQLVTAPNDPNRQTQVGLQDRIAQALTRKNVTEPERGPQFARPQPRQLSQAGYSQQVRGSSLPASSTAQDYGPRVAMREDIDTERHQVVRAVENQQLPEYSDGQRRSNSVRQTSMDQPIQDPFRDRDFSTPQTVPRPLTGPIIPVRVAQDLPGSLNRPVFNRPSNDRVPTKQVSILNRPQDQAEAESVELDGLDSPDSFAFSDNSSVYQENDFSPRGNPRSIPRVDLNSGNAQSPRLQKPENNRSTLSSGAGQEANPSQDLRDRLDELMKETENDLRSSGEKNTSKRDDRSVSPQRKTDQGTRSLLDMDDESDNEKTRKKTPLDKSCDEFRNELLDNPIRDIPLDLSPIASDLRNQYTAIARSWTDRSGNIIASGSMMDLRRGYVILDSGQKIAFARLSDADLAAVSEYWQIPVHCSVGNRGSVDRNWDPQTFTWTATSLCHKPLYFENIQLERYGHSHGPFTQPVRSVAHFFVSLATLPYQTAISPANECEYALGLFRPGDCAPWLKDPVPISLDGMRRQALVSTGLGMIP